MVRTLRGLASIPVVCALVALAGCGGGSSSGAAGDPVGEFAQLVNDHRDSIGCNRLGWDDQLAKAAKTHSDDMATRKFVAHVTPDGVGTLDRLRAAGYSSGGENIAVGFGSAQAVFSAWMSSPGHRENIEKCAWKAHGAGMTSSGGVWTYLVAR